MRFDHIGVTTAGLEAGRTLLESAVGVQAWTEPFEDTVNLGCNFMSLGRARVIVPKSSRSLIVKLRAHGFEVAEVDMSEISKTGGGIHCMAQALRRDPNARG